MKNTNLRLLAAPLSPSFRGTPAQFFAELIRLIRIVSPDGHYGIVVADIEPESNQGLWLKNGTKPYVWSDDEAKYVPADITDGIAVQLTQLADLVSKMTAGRVLFSQLEPGETERTNVVWVQTGESGAALSVRLWDPAASAWRLLPGTTRFSVSATGVTDDQYRITLDSPASLSQLVGVPVVVQWHRTSTGPVTIAVDGLATAANLIDSSTGTQVSAGAVREGQVSQIVYDGALWQVISPAGGGAAHGSLLVTTAGDDDWTVPSGVTDIKVTCVGGGGGGGFNASAWGGGGGGTCVKWWKVTPGQVLTFKVGAGGAREESYGGGGASAGGDTIFNSSQIARGGAHGAGTANGGSFVGADHGFPGANGKWVWISDKAGGGYAAFPGSLFGATSVADVGNPPREPRYGGGGGGDRDSTENDATDGAAGVILIEW